MKGASAKQIGDWFDEGVKRGARYMLVVCDTFSYEDFPCYANDDAACWARHRTAMADQWQRLMEVYDLSLPKDVQLRPGTRVMNMPPRLVTK